MLSLGPRQHVQCSWAIQVREEFESQRDGSAFVTWCLAKGRGAVRAVVFIDDALCPAARERGETRFMGALNAGRSHEHGGRAVIQYTCGPQREGNCLELERQILFVGPLSKADDIQTPTRSYCQTFDSKV